MPTSTVATRATSATAARSTSPFLRRVLLCVALTIFNVFVVAEFAGVLYEATFGNDFEQIAVSVLFLALLASLGRTWYVALANRPQYEGKRSKTPTPDERRTHHATQLGKDVRLQDVRLPGRRGQFD